MVVPRHGLGRQRPPGLGSRVEHFGKQHAVGIRENEGPFLPARDEDLAVGQDDGVGEAARVGHGRDLLDGGGCAGLGDGGDVGLVGGGRVGVVLGAAGAEDVTGGVHGPNAAHAVLGVANAGGGLGAVACGGVPVLVLAGAGLEDAGDCFGLAVTIQGLETKKKKDRRKTKHFGNQRTYEPSFQPTSQAWLSSLQIPSLSTVNMGVTSAPGRYVQVFVDGSYTSPFLPSRGPE